MTAVMNPERARGQEKCPVDEQPGRLVGGAELQEKVTPGDLIGSAWICLTQPGRTIAETCYFGLRILLPLLHGV